MNNFLKLIVIPALLLISTINLANANERLQTYRVVGVSHSDPSGLNVRDNVIEAQSLGETNVVGNLAWNQKGILSSGLVVEIGNSVWREIRAGNVRGWVNEKYLAKETGPHNPELTPDRLKCSGTEPFWSINYSKKGPLYNGTELENGDWLENAKLETMAVHPIVEMGAGAWSVTLKSKSDGSYLQTIISKASPMCDDGMSNLLYPYQVIVLKGQVPRPIYGCCKINIER